MEYIWGGHGPILSTMVRDGLLSKKMAFELRSNENDAGIWKSEKYGPLSYVRA